MSKNTPTARGPYPGLKPLQNLSRLTDEHLLSILKITTKNMTPIKNKRTQVSGYTKY